MKPLTTILLVFIAETLFAQAPPVQWKKCFGGNAHDSPYDIYQTSDGGFIIGGNAQSVNGQVTGNHGGSDYWIVKTDTSGNIVWSKCYGGTGTEGVASIEQTTDGGYIVGGVTQSVNGDVSGNHGGGDNWVVKIDSAGNLQWQKCLGGTGSESWGRTRQTIDGGYIVASATQSNNGDVTKNNGGVDYWVVKLDTGGTIQWQRSYGGSKNDVPTDVRQTIDKGYIVAGYSSSNDSDVIGHHGGTPADMWIIKLDTAGAMQWQKSLGGTSGDNANSIMQTHDGGYIVAGHTGSTDGDVSGLRGFFDFWLVKTDSAGAIEWQRCIGGTRIDMAFGVDITLDSGYIVTGGSYSDDGDATLNQGNIDYWVVKTNSTGNMQWQKSFGGSDIDEPYITRQTRDRGYIVCGQAASANGDVADNHGMLDYWIIKLRDTTEACNFTAAIQANQLIFCSGDSAQVCAPSGLTAYLWNTGQTTSCIATQFAGNYYVTVTDNNGCTAESNHLAISVYPLPPVSITTNGDTLTVYEAVTQQWYLNGSAISGATSNIYIATGGGSYTVAVTDSNGCVATSNPIIISGVENFTEEDAVCVAQLTVGSWQLTVGNNFIGREVEVFDVNGRVVWKSEIGNPKSEITLDVSRGVYLLRISSAKQSVVRKLVRL